MNRAGRITVRAGMGNGARPNSQVPGWHVRQGSSIHVFFEHQSAARRYACNLRLDPDYEVTFDDFKSVE